MKPTYPMTHNLPIPDDAPWLDCMDGLCQAVDEHLKNCRNTPAPPTDCELFEEAVASGLVAHVRLAAACHPDKIKLEEVCSPANASMIVFARKVLERWGN